MPFDLQKLIEMAPFLMGAFRGPSPEGNAMLEGYIKGQAGKRTLAEQDRERQRQALMDALQQQQQQFSNANVLRDNARADEALQLQRETAGLTRQSAQLGKVKTLQDMATTRAGQIAEAPGSDASTPDAQNTLAADLFQMTQSGGMQPGAARGMLPNMTGLIAERDKQHYRAQLDKALKNPMYADLVKTGDFDKLNIRTRAGKLIPVSEVRRQLGDELLTDSGVPVAGTPPVAAGTETERTAELLDKIETATDPAAKAKFQRQYDHLIAAKKALGQADDRPRVTVQTGVDGVSDVKEAVAGMKDGTIPPQIPGRASKDYTAVMAEAHRQGYDLSSAVTDWTATQKHIATLNGAQQLRLNQAINSLPDMLDSVDALASKWKGGRFPILNRVNLKLAKGGAYGSEVASVANQLDAQIADVTADLGNVYMGGNSPTDHALGLAAKSLGGDWDEKVLHDMVKLAKKNVQIRQNSVKHTGVAGASAGNPYQPAPAGAAGRTRVKGPNGESGSVPEGTALPAGWTVVP